METDGLAFGYVTQFMSLVRATKMPEWLHNESIVAKMDRNSMQICWYSFRGEISHPRKRHVFDKSESDWKPSDNFGNLPKSLQPYIASLNVSLQSHKISFRLSRNKAAFVIEVGNNMNSKPYLVSRVDRNGREILSSYLQGKSKR